MNYRFSYLHFLWNIVFFVLGCSVSSLFFILDYVGKSDHSSSLDVSFRPQVDVLIIIISAPKNRLQRDALRTTWLTLTRDTSIHYFVVGEEGLAPDEADRLRNEQRNHGDLLVLPIVDSYRNLSLKLASGINLVTQLYMYRYLIKIDDDSFVHINRVENELKKIDSPVLYWGYFSHSAHVFKTGKWKETDWFLCDRYLPYAVGGGYVLGYRLARFIADNYLQFKIYSSEDVSVGVWLAPLITKRVHDIRFDTQAKSRGCFNDDIIKHKVAPSLMKYYYDRIDHSQNLCDKEVSTDLKPYSYDWNTKPSKCCITVDPRDLSVPRYYASHVGHVV